MSLEQIRRQVEDRHWQLFEQRLKRRSSSEFTEENYTKTNDYRVIDRLKSTDDTQKPLEPHQRWKNFSSQLTSTSNESDRLISLLRNVWQTNWNTRTDDQHEQNSISRSNTFLHQVTLNERDRQVINAILHRS